MGVMRSSLIGGLVATLLGNLKRQVERVRVFELGRCFFPDVAEATAYKQPLRLAGLVAGHVVPEQWGSPGRPVDFYDLKGDLEALFAPRELRFEKIPGAGHPALHPGRSAQVSVDGNVIGILGELHPQWCQKYELSVTATVFEIDLASLLECPMPIFKGTSRFPAVVRDLALVLPQTCAVQEVLDAFQKVAPSYVQDIQLFDVYQGKGIAPDHKSLAFRVTMQDTQRTLADEDADQAVAELLDVAQRQFAAMLRR
jgi:phenylalanyl-tRNA synthetase beta chain